MSEKAQTHRDADDTRDHWSAKRRRQIFQLVRIVIEKQTDGHIFQLIQICQWRENVRVKMRNNTDHGPEKTRADLVDHAVCIFTASSRSRSERLPNRTVDLAIRLYGVCVPRFVVAFLGVAYGTLEVPRLVHDESFCEVET